MLSIILSSSEISFWNGSALFGVGILAGMMVALAASSQRWLLRYVIGAIGYGFIVELLHIAMMRWLALSDWHGYVAAIGVSWLPLFGWILYRALRFDDVSTAMTHERKRAAARYVEHSPIYDEYTPRFDQQ